MFGTFGIRSITAIFLGLYVIANKCHNDINGASKDLAQCAVRIRNAITICKADSERCTAERSSVVEYMVVAKDSMSHAVGCLAALTQSQECQDDGRYVGQDFAVIGVKAFEIIQDCVLTRNGDCKDDANYIVMAIDDAIANIDKSLTDCDFPAGSNCVNDFVLLSKKLAEAEKVFIKAETDCIVVGDACVDDMLVAVAEFLDASSWAVTSIYDCTNLMPRRHDH